ncbi:MAG: class I SAM-dependent methyltransferase [Dehalococcoidales bacterium]|nr:class I SAM-dependent methyltransferase [Dehalococcoidales bacterium]
MKPVNDPETDYKDLVRKGYNDCASAYSQARKREVTSQLLNLIDRLEENSRILDIGCGSGMPVTQVLTTKFEVTGVDISEEMLKRAQVNVPKAQFILGDIMSVELPPSHFHAVVSYYTVFHIPREEHPELFRKIHRWLMPGGYLLASVALDNEADYTEDDFFGVTMYWSNYSLVEYQDIITSSGFSILETSILEHGYDEKNTKVERHPLIFARKD